jgi:hypothetical protein
MAIRQERERERRERKEHFPWHRLWYADSPPSQSSFCNGDRQTDTKMSLQDDGTRWRARHGRNA